MKKYIINRLLWMIFVLVGAAILIFTILYFIPGDTAAHFLGESATVEDIARFNSIHGLDKPYAMQLLNFLRDLFLRADFGISFKFNTPVIEELASRIPRTLFLGVSCIIVNALIGIPLGMMAALHQNKWQDTLCMVLALLFVSVPSFWLALELVDIFALKLGLVPVFGIDTWNSWILPIFAGSMSGVAANARQTRSSMLETIRADFITTARAKGVEEGKVVRKHMFPNALIPVVTGLGVGLSKSIAGSVVIEQIFTIPGVGTYMLSGINNYDYPIVRSSVVILAAFSSIVMLLVDIVYAMIDPRIKAQYAGKAKER